MCLLVVLVGIAAAVVMFRPAPPSGAVGAAPAVAPSRSAAAPRVPEAARRGVPVPANLPVIDYYSVPAGFPPDPAPRSTAPVTEGLRPVRPLAVHDAPGGRPRAFLPPTISGVPVTVPVVGRRAGWFAVLLPSVNRTVGWVPAHGWVRQGLRDQLVLRRRSHELTWLRDGARRATWTVAVGSAATPTPLGRTFVLGRTKMPGEVYAGLDALALGSVPDDRASVSAALRGAHTGIHSWYRADSFGRSVSNGCIRVPRAAQRALLAGIGPGTTVIVVD